MNWPQCDTTQGSKNCGILRSRLVEPGVHLENIENIEIKGNMEYGKHGKDQKHQPDYSKHSIYNSKQSFSRHLLRQSKIITYHAWRTRSWVSSRLENFKASDLRWPDSPPKKCKILKREEWGHWYLSQIDPPLPLPLYPGSFCGGLVICHIILCQAYTFNLC